MIKADISRVGGLFLPNKDNAKLRRARSPLHILVVDDDPVTCRMMQNVFEEKYWVKTCTNIQDAVTEYFRVMPDLVFLDINLGDRNYSGLDVLRLILKEDHEANIIMLSGSDSRDNVIESWNCGAKGFVLKPFVVARLFEYAKQCEERKVNGAGLWN